MSESPSAEIPAGAAIVGASGFTVSRPLPARCGAVLDEQAPSSEASGAPATSRRNSRREIGESIARGREGQPNRSCSAPR